MLYSIAGLFVEDFPGISPWGGYFAGGIEGEEGIQGQLVDIHGQSRIDGLMNDRVMRFTKVYDNCNLGQAFDYSFVKKDGLWRGEFTGRSGYSGKSICRTAPILGNLDFRNIDCRTTEGYIEAIVESMVEAGQLRKFTDKDSGEEMVEPV